ncbi:unnamed protein product, partial [marine sediment metagenome]
WTISRCTNRIYKVDKNQGAVICWFDNPSSDLYGLTWDDNPSDDWCIWGSDPIENKIHKIDTNSGLIVQSFNAPGTAPHGLTWRNGYLWIVDGDSDKIYQINPSNGTVNDSFNAPSPDPTGLTWGKEYIWSADWYEKKIYKVDVFYDPTAHAGGPYTTKLGRQLQFDGRASHDNDEGASHSSDEGDRDIEQYDWKFFEEDSWREDLGPRPTYTYGAIGSYKLTLRVYDDEGASDTVSTTVTINPLILSSPGTYPTGVAWDD